MYICDCCSRVFEEPRRAEERHNENYSEPLALCPYCDWGTPVKAERCRQCGEWFAEDDINNGFCEDCLTESLTLDSFLSYATSDDDDNILEEFMFQWIYGYEWSDVPDTHKLLREALIRDYEYWRKKDAEFLIENVRRYMKDYMYEYAEFMKEAI